MYTHTQNKSSFNSGVENHSVGWDMYSSGIVRTTGWRFVTDVAGTTYHSHLKGQAVPVEILVELLDPWKWDR